MKPLLALTLLFTASTAMAFDSVTDLMKHFSAQRIEALLHYVEAHPNAEDIPRAYDALIDGYVIQEDYKQALALLEKKYHLIKDADQPDMRSLFGEIVPTHAVLSLQAGMKAEGKAFMEQVLKDFKDHEAFPQIQQMMTQWQEEFNLPGPGEVMDIRFKPVNGEKEVSLAELKGKVVLVDFWATWCAPCVEAMPELKKAYDTYHEKGFEILGISADQSKKALTAFIEREKLPWAQAFDGELQNSLIEKFSISRFPTTFLIGKDGKVAAVDVMGAELEERLKDLL